MSVYIPNYQFATNGPATPSTFTRFRIHHKHLWISFHKITPRRFKNILAYKYKTRAKTCHKTVKNTANMDS